MKEIKNTLCSLILFINARYTIESQGSTPMTKEKDLKRNIHLNVSLSDLTELSTSDYTNTSLQYRPSPIPRIVKSLITAEYLQQTIRFRVYPHLTIRRGV